MYDFAMGHPVATFFIAWLLTWSIVSVLATLSGMYKRTLRAMVLARCGWPPPHLDADGDWKPEPEREK